MVKDLLAEYRESPATSAPLKGPIIINLNQAGLQVGAGFGAAGGGRGWPAARHGVIRGSWLHTGPRL